MCLKVDIESAVIEGENFVLHPGCSYHLQIKMASPDKISGGGQVWSMSTETVQVVLDSPEYTDLMIESGSLDDPRVILAGFDDVRRGFEDGFIIDVPPRCPRGVRKLALSIYEDAARLRPVLKMDMQVDFKGEEYEFTSPLQDVWRLKISGSAPAERIAFLHVRHGANSSLSLDAWHRRLHRGMNSEPINPALVPTLERRYKVEGRTAMFDLGRIVDFSESFNTLLSWLAGVLDVSTRPPILVVMDTSDLEIPWELFPIRGDEYVGNSMEVVRWVRMDEDRDRVELCLDEEMVSGPVYFSGDKSGESPVFTAAEAAELEILRATPLKTKGDLTGCLSCGVSDVGLLYIACHGHLYTTEQGQPHWRLNLDGGELHDFDLYALGRCDGRLPMVFVNACHSGRVRGGRGFVVIFLRRFARAYVGTLGAVDREQAQRVGVRMLKSFRDRGKVRMSELLLDLRSEEFCKWVNSRAEVYLENVFNICSFVYYGNPLLEIDLSDNLD